MLDVAIVFFIGIHTAIVAGQFVVTDFRIAGRNSNDHLLSTLNVESASGHDQTYYKPR